MKSTRKSYSLKGDGISFYVTFLVFYLKFLKTDFISYTAKFNPKIDKF